MCDQTLTTTQRVQVAKDRAVDELTDIINSKGGYFHLDHKDISSIEKISLFLLMPDCNLTTLSHARMLGYINDEEELFFQGD